MRNRESFFERLVTLGGLTVLCLIACIAVMFNAQIVHGEEYRVRSMSSATHAEKVSASRGVITDRNGKVMVSNRMVYTLKFDASAIAAEERNDAIVRLLSLLTDLQVPWNDDLPVTQTAPFAYQPRSSSQAKALTNYLIDKKLMTDSSVGEDGLPTLSPDAVVRTLCSLYEVDASLPEETRRAVAGFRYSLALAESGGETAFRFADNVDISLISQIKDGKYLGVRVDSSSERVYETTAAAHVLGRVGKLYAEEYEELKDKGYAYNDIIGKDGIELAYESYLRGKDGVRVVTMNKAGNVIDETYADVPENGCTVALTLDLDFQEKVEQILASRVGAMVQSDGLSRAAAVAVVEVGTGDILALASYPTYSLATYSEDYARLSQSALSPYVNRATQGTYAPGSTFKPLTAIAALETGIIEPNTYITTRGQYSYYDLRLNCWLYSTTGRTHGTINVSQALTESCNYFFYDVGRMTGISTLARYAGLFGLGQPTGIELPERIGSMTTPDYVNSIKGHRWTDGQTLTAAIGQSYSQFTPLQLANYVATLAGGGTRYPAHLLKSVRRSESPTVVDVYDESPVTTIPLKEENLNAVLTGMHNLAKNGSVSQYFANCVVDAAAKTGTAQTGRSVSNGVFVCYAPFDDPEIAVAVVIEKGGSGGAVASTAVDILNAYFSEEPGSSVGENELLP